MSDLIFSIKEAFFNLFEPVTSGLFHVESELVTAFTAIFLYTLLSSSSHWLEPVFKMIEKAFFLVHKPIKRIVVGGCKVLIWYLVLFADSTPWVNLFLSIIG